VKVTSRSVLYNMTGNFVICYHQDSGIWVGYLSTKGGQEMLTEFCVTSLSLSLNTDKSIRLTLRCFLGMQVMRIGGERSWLGVVSTTSARC
jgi:hypothetical protein